MVIMSEVKSRKKNCSTTQQQQSSSVQQNTAKQKRKRWMVEKYKKKKPPTVEKVAEKSQKPDKLMPPTDGQQFSTNWKKLQEVNCLLFYCRCCFD